MSEFLELVKPTMADSLLERFAPLGSEKVPLDQAAGRRLHEPVSATEPLPAFDRSTMDGYAVMARDTFGASPGGPVYLTLVGEVAMGQSTEQMPPLKPGETAAIATGGMLPAGADAVVMVEYTQKVMPVQVEIVAPVAVGQHVIRRGQELSAGAQILPSGAMVRPQDLGLMAALGIQEVEVHLRPRVVIYSTGDELVPHTAPARPGTVRDLNGPVLAAQVREAGGEPIYEGIVPDVLEVLIAAVQKGLAEGDMVLLSGGSSVGRRDLSVQVLEKLAGGLHFHGIKIRPGRPTLAAEVDGKPVIGLPGHPVSSLVIFHRFVRPLVWRLAGMKRTDPWTHRLRAVLGRGVRSVPGKVDLVPVRIEKDGESLIAVPVAGGSAAISTLVQAHGILELSEGEEGLASGAQVEVYLFEEPSDLARRMEHR